MSSIQSFPKRCTSISLCIAAGLSFISLSLSAQSPQLTTATHAPRATDSLIIYQIPYSPVTGSGKDCVWDFSRPAQPPIERYADFYRPVPNDTTRIAKHFYGANRYYHLSSDTLFITGYETPTFAIRYTSPEKQMVFPFRYGDSVHSTFAGTGEYAHRTTFAANGYTTIHADAMGKLMLPTITIDTALRIHTTRCYTATERDTAIITTDIYQWFSPLYRYPLLETICERTTTHNDSTGVTLAFYHEPIELDTQHENDTPPIEMRPQDTSDDANTVFTNASFLPNPVHDMLHISYALSRDARIYFSVHYSGGTCFHQSAPAQQTAGDHRETIDMTAFPTGNYVLYIHVDDTILSQPVIKL